MITHENDNRRPLCMLQYMIDELNEFTVGITQVANVLILPYLFAFHQCFDRISSAAAVKEIWIMRHHQMRIDKPGLIAFPQCFFLRAVEQGFGAVEVFLNQPFHLRLHPEFGDQLEPEVPVEP